MSLLTTPAAWTSILDCIRKRISTHRFATWFENLKADSRTPDELIIRVPNRFFREWLAQNYLSVIRDSVEEATGSRPRIRFTLDESVQPNHNVEAEAGVSAPAHASASAVRGIRLNDQFTFDTFVVGPSNQLAHAAAKAVSREPGRTYNPLFVYGSVGLGKSHLLQAICQNCLDHDRRKRIAYLSCETFVNEFISAIQRNELPGFRERYRRLDILVIDDIQFLSRAERSQEEFFHTFNDLYNGQKQIVLSSDQPPQEISGLRERLVSRFKSGLVTRIDPPSYEMRVAVLQKKAALRHVSVPKDIIEYIASVITSNIRELDGAVTKVVGYASLLRQPITVELAKTALHEPPEARRPLTIDEIMKVVTKHFNVRISDLQSKRRTRSIVEPRQICMFLARDLTRLSLEEIGGYFGGRDHSTVLHAEEKIKSRIKEQAEFGRLIQQLRQMLNHASGNVQ